MDPFSVTIIILLGLAILAVVSSVKVVGPYEKGVIVRLGRYRATVSSGVNFVMPFIESVIKVDMREQVIQVEPQKVITEDNVGVEVDCVIYYKVVDPVKAEFEVEDFSLACTTLAQTNLRNLIGDKSLDETLVARDSINESLREVLDEATHSWGVKVTRVEVQRIDPPQDITQAMSKQMKAEREKRAAILEAEGKKQAAILEAEGVAKARVLQAISEAEALQKVSEAAQKYFKDRPEILRRLEVAEKVLTNNTKYIVPAGSDLVNVLNMDGQKIVPVKK